MKKKIAKIVTKIKKKILKKRKNKSEENKKKDNTHKNINIEFDIIGNIYNGQNDKNNEINAINDINFSNKIEETLIKSQIEENEKINYFKLIREEYNNKEISLTFKTKDIELLLNRIRRIKLDKFSNHF